MKSKTEHIVAKIFSGRWILTVTAAGVFAYLACSGAMQPENAEKLIGIVLAFYFGQRSSSTPNGNGNG